eukprot:6195715-Pleurochrysis_carterae.AAC.5
MQPGRRRPRRRQRACSTRWRQLVAPPHREQAPVRATLFAGTERELWTLFAAWAGSTSLCNICSYPCAGTMASREVTQDDFDYHVSDRQGVTNKKTHKAALRSDKADRHENSKVRTSPKKAPDFQEGAQDVDLHSVASKESWHKRGHSLLDPDGLGADLSDDEDVVDSILGWIQVTFKVASKRNARRWCWVVALLLAALSSICIFLLIATITNIGRDPRQHHQSHGYLASTQSRWEEFKVPALQSQSPREPRSDLLPPLHAPPPSPPPPLPCAPGFASAIKGHYECVQLSLEHPQRCASLASLTSQEEDESLMPEQGIDRRALLLRGSLGAAEKDGTGQQSDTSAFSNAGLGEAILLEDDVHFDRRLDAAATFDPELILR